MPAISGIDIGYGFTKIYYSQNSTGSEDSCRFDMFPSAVSKFIPKMTFSDSQSIVTVNNEQFLVGESAVREGIGMINTRQSDFVGSNAYCAILSLALARTSVNPDIMILGLPPGQYNRQYADMIMEKVRSARIALPNGTLTGVPRTIRYIPQGSGIFFSHLRNEENDVFNLRVAVLDVGYYTLDTLFLVKGKYVENSAQSRQLGVSCLYEQVRKEFQNEFRVSLKSHMTIEQILNTGKVTIMGRSYEFDARRILEAYNAEVSSNVSNYIENLPDEVDVLIGGGGGVKYLNSGAFKYRFLITDHPQFANARGYFEYGKHVMARG
ncbi:ParM/StbA family protein [candidate division WS5 bacterium]|uniref:ParM/StbA family protein n=1 Tax=candidate division WS5 bacterium TaxID=2093353 RepID=A0A419DB65_9BACT|nr:MAG: ParM/StbA family protein [candidate division WS5 bacterium]